MMEIKCEINGRRIMWLGIHKVYEDSDGYAKYNVHDLRSDPFRHNVRKSSPVLFTIEHRVEDGAEALVEKVTREVGSSVYDNKISTAGLE